MSEDVPVKWPLKKKIGGFLLVVIFLIVVYLILAYKYDWWPFDDDPSCIRPTSPIIGYDLTGVTDTDLSIANFTVTGVACDTGYSGAAAATACDTAGVPYTLGGCTVTPPPVVGNCVSFDCAGQTNSLSGNPGSIRCSGDPCTATECCTVTPPPVVGNCGGFTCTDGYTIKSPLPTGDCVVDPCTQLECCDATVETSCTLPEPAPTGYVYGGNEAVTGTGTTDITCDATNGWHSDGDVVASCDATTFYSLSGCTQGCAKPVHGTVTGYNLTAAAPVVPVVPIGTGTLSGASCAAEYTGDNITYDCVAAAAATETQYYSVQGCTLTTDPSCTLPEPAPTGYVYGGNKAVTGTGPDTTDITCDATNGWHSDAASSIVASCDATTFYSLSGCTQGCAKPVPGTVPGYNLTAAPEFLDYGEGPVNIGGSCSVGGAGSVLGSCIDDVTEAIDYYTVEGCPPPVVSTQLPPTCSAPPQGQTGYIITDVNIGRPTGIVVDGVTCDASNGWFAPTGDIYFNCPSQGHSRFGGCEQGCSKPNYDMPWLDLTHAPATLQIGAQGTQGVTCTYSGTPSVQCLTAGQDYLINNCSHQPPVVSTQLRACADIMVSGNVPRIAGVLVDMTGISETDCINHCSSQATCKSISYDSDDSRCYTYDAEHAPPFLALSNYNYYPEKCQP